MTNGRRTLRFASLDEVMPEVARLRRGHTTLGTWTLAQVCRHLANVMNRVIDLPASTPRDPSLEFGLEKKREVFETGRLPEGLPAPPGVVPSGELDEGEEAEGLGRAIDRFRSSPGPLAPHRFFGPLTRDEWHQLQCIHCAHHLSFVIPATETT
jgi:hypothetical protein